MSENIATPDDSRAAPVRVLAFTCSQHRPLMLRHCVMQMQRQSHPVDHAIYINSPDEDEADSTSTRYDALLTEATSETGGRIILGHGKSGSSLENYVAALRLIDLDGYDLFLKVDDDDIYFRSYAEDVVADFVANRWDYSGTHSNGLINGRRWYPDQVKWDLGLDFVDLELRVPSIMPPTVALSRRAIRTVLASTDTGNFDDIQWRRTVAQHPELVMAQRSDRNFVYNIHGGNASTASWLKS